jgi:hypothetical protein
MIMLFAFLSAISTGSYALFQYFAKINGVRFTGFNAFSASLNTDFTIFNALIHSFKLFTFCDTMGAHFYAFGTEFYTCFFHFLD